MSLVRVLAVDADYAYLVWLAQSLASWGYEVRSATDARTAIRLAESYDPHLLLIDAFLPGSGGPAVVQSVRARLQREIGVVFTAVAELTSGVAFETVLDIDDFVVKSPNAREVADRLRRAHLRAQRIDELAQELTRRAVGFGAIDKPQRKRITVLFSDVRGFTLFSESKDPETVAAVLNELFDIQRQSVRRFGGYVDKFIGDGMMALFGLEQSIATELDRGDPELAAMFAGQEILESVAEAHTVMLFSSTTLALGIGIHTGDAVVGPIGPLGQRDFTAVGDTVNLASRLCGEASPSEIIVSEAQLAEIRGSVEILDRRTVQLKGKAEPTRLFSVRLGR